MFYGQDALDAVSARPSRGIRHVRHEAQPSAAGQSSSQA